MDHRYIEEQHIVDRFLMGHLDAGEAERFQDHSMSCTECLDNLALAEKMHQGMRDAFAGEAGRIVAGSLPKRRAWLNQSWLSAAAVLVLALVAGILALRMNRVDADLEDARHRLSQSEAQVGRLQDSLSPRTNIPIFKMSPERSTVTTRDPTWLISTTEQPEWLVLVLNTAMPGGGPFHGRIFRTDKTPIWQGQDLRADGAGDVTIGMFSTHLPAGDYHLVLEERLEGRPVHVVARYYFRVSTP